MMKFWAIAAVLVVVLVGSAAYLRSGVGTSPPGPALARPAVGCREVSHDFAARETGVWVTLDAAVERVLPDAAGRYLHQRFIVRCSDGQTVLIVNDVSVGQRVPVFNGGQVEVRGQYIWNDLGGLVHYTHHDDAGGPGGWIIWHGHVYSVPALGWKSLRTKTWITE